MFLIQQCWLWGEACSQRHVEYKSSSLPLKSWKDVAPCPIQLKNNEKAEHYPWLRIVKNILLLELHWIQQGTLIFGHHRSSPNSARKEQACGFVQVFVQADPLVGKELHTIFITYSSLSWCTLLRAAWPSSKIFTTKLRNTASHHVKVLRD